MSLSAFDNRPRELTTMSFEALYRTCWNLCSYIAVISEVVHNSNASQTEVFDCS